MYTARSPAGLEQELSEERLGELSHRHRALPSARLFVELAVPVDDDVEAEPPQVLLDPAVVRPRRVRKQRSLVCQLQPVSEQTTRGGEGREGGEGG